MSTKFEKLTSLLKELFQLDRADLDFGIYRIMHQRSAEIVKFLDQDLLPQVESCFSVYQSSDKAAIHKDLAEAIKQAAQLGVDSETVPKVRDLKAKLANESVDIASLEGEVYDHLFNFFRRYYSEGDFISKRVYKDGVYSIPYEGEEVKLYWANADQYYVKTSEYLRDYAFRLQPENTTDPMRVHFTLIDASEGEHGNVKEADEKGRVFILASADFITFTNKELSINFEYRAAQLTDWDNQGGKTKPPTQKELIQIAEARILAVTGSAFAAQIAELAKKYRTADGDAADYTILAAHLNRYTARNTFDYFIHKDLKKFLKRELDFYIKNEVMHLDDIESETTPRVEQYLSKIKVIRKVANKIIDFLSQLEDFQKALWLKKKFVVSTDYCLTLDRIDESFYPEIAANDAQREEWVRLFVIDEIKGTPADLVTAEIPGYSNPLTAGFLKANDKLVLDTKFFTSDFKNHLIASIENIDAQTNGLLVHSENFQALNLLQERYREQVKCIYIDPPYNIGGNDFPYKDSYQHSSWAAMMFDRLDLSKNFLINSGVFAQYIDENEHILSSQIISAVFNQENRSGDIIWKNSSKNDQSYVSMQHEYLLTAVKNKVVNLGNWTELKEGLDEIYSAFEGFKKQYGTDWKAIHKAALEWYKQFPESNPIVDSKHYSWMDERGVYFPDNISGPNYGQYRYDVIHPITGKICKEPSSGWRYPETTMKQKIKDNLVHFGDSEETVPNNKTFLKNTENQSLTSIKYRDGRVASKLLQAMFDGKVFKNPKDVDLGMRLLKAFETDESLILDYFAGSGTTGHAVINLNREDGGNRKYILVEMGNYFDTVTKPRIQKVIYSDNWKDGKPVSRNIGVSQCVKYIRLESYEDTLNNIHLKRTPSQQTLLDMNEAKGADGFAEDYRLRYLLETETRGSPSMLDLDAFLDPDSYFLTIKTPGSDESREIAVDLVETFNYLLGVTVEAISAPTHLDATFERDSEKRLTVKKGKLTEKPAGAWWFRTVTGTAPDGRNVLVIWRNRPGKESEDGIEQDNLVLNEWFKSHKGWSTKNGEFDSIYVNGTNNLENLKTADSIWKVRLIEEDFKRLMFEGTEN